MGINNIKNESGKGENKIISLSKTKRNVKRTETNQSCFLGKTNSLNKTKRGVNKIKKKLLVIKIKKITMREKTELKRREKINLFLASFLIISTFATGIPVFMFC